jgi:hypothetical protein
MLVPRDVFGNTLDFTYADATAFKARPWRTFLKHEIFEKLV